MKTTKRFENAVSKLYNAFHENRLNAFNSTHCAVGNICGNTSTWSEYWYTNTFKKLTQEVKQFSPNVLNTNYTSGELSEVELIFLRNFNLEPSAKNGKDKEQQFKGLCAVVEYLAELDNIPNPMDYSKLFETENESAKYSLVEVFN